MKKSITILFCIAFSICFSLNSFAQNDKIIGEKSTNPQISKAILAKYKNDIERQYSAYLKKQAEAESAADALRKKLEEAMKNLEASDRLGNFEIQRLMSEFNQAEQLASQVLKKREETKKGVVSKL